MIERDTEDILKGVAASAGLRVVFGLYAALVFFYTTPGFLTKLGLLATPFSLWSAWSNYDKGPSSFLRGVVWPWLTFTFMLALTQYLGATWGILITLAVFMGYRTYKYWDTVKQYKTLGRMVRQDFQRGDGDD